MISNEQYAAQLETLKAKEAALTTQTQQLAAARLEMITSFASIGITAVISIAAAA